MVDAQIQWQRKLDLRLFQGSETTQTDRKVGEVYYNSAAICRQPAGFPSPDIPKLEAGCEKLIKQWQEAGKLAFTGTCQSSHDATSQQVHLTDLVREQPLDEAKHMQPLVMDMLRAVSEAVGSPQVLVDTHNSNYLKRPTGMIDCCRLASELVEWTQLVVPWQFKLSSDHAVSLLGQLVDRCEALFDRQPRRQHVFAVGIMLDAVEVYAISRKNGRFTVERTGLVPLSIDGGSRALQLVASILQASMEQLGYCSHQLPASFQLGGYTISNAQLIKEGGITSTGHPATFVFRVAVDGQGPAILKLSQDDHEETILKDLDGLEHVVQFWVSGMLSYDRSMWHALVLQPYGRLLERSDAPSLIARVASDVAQAISDCASRSIAHRDVTAGNFVVYQQQGYLCDFSAAKVVKDCLQLPSPTGFTCSPVFAAVSVLEGGPHTCSSMYEGLFYSLLYICRGGRLPDEWAFKFGGHKEMAKVRRGYIMCEPPIATWDVPEGVAPLIRGLHALFWPQTRDGGFKYRMGVTKEEVQNVCTQFAA